VYQLHTPNTILLGKTASDLAITDVPKVYLNPAESPRAPSCGRTGYRFPLRHRMGVRFRDSGEKRGCPQLPARPSSSAGGRCRPGQPGKAALDRAA